MRTSDLLLRLNLRMNTAARGTKWKVSLLLLFPVLIVCVLSQPMLDSRYAFATGIAPAAAQQTIACSQTRSGGITASGQQDTYTFNGNAGEVVSISVVTTSGNLCAWAELYNPAGAPIANFGGVCNSLLRAQLPATGAYTILVRDFSLNRIGKYNVNLTCLGSTCAPALALSLAPNPLTITANSSGSMTATIGVAQSAATTVTLSSSNNAVATVPATAPIPANATSVTFPVAGVASGSATITATLPASLGGAWSVCGQCQRT
jgi:hypothetical protein